MSSESSTLPYPILVCVDCLMMLANGTLGNEDEAEDGAHAERMGQEWSDTLLTLGWSAEEYPEGVDPMGDSADEAGFSWRHCEGCGSTLGGDRYRATAWHK
jgi:hypothetical protein